LGNNRGFANGNPTNNNGALDNPDQFDADVPEIGPGTPKGPDGLASNPQGGGGGAGGGGSPLGGGPSGGGGSGKPQSQFSTDVLGGVSSGSGAPGGGGSNSYGAGGGAGGGPDFRLPGSIGGAGGNLDLKKYLPGGQLGPQGEGINDGITKANGLSNFQKVNRAHNQNRPALVNP